MCKDLDVLHKCSLRYVSLHDVEELLEHLILVVDLLEMEQECCCKGISVVSRSLVLRASNGVVPHLHCSRQELRSVDDTKLRLRL